MKYAVVLKINQMKIVVGEINIEKDELQNLEDAFQCDTVYEIFDMFKGVTL